MTGNQMLLGNGGSAGALAGNGGNGTYQLSGGTLTATSVANRGVMLGTNDGGTSTFNLSGTGSLLLTGNSSQLMVGRSDSPVVNTTNLFNQTGGTASVTILSIGGGRRGHRPQFEDSPSPAARSARRVSLPWVLAHRASSR